MIQRSWIGYHSFGWRVAHAVRAWRGWTFASDRAQDPYGGHNPAASHIDQAWTWGRRLK